MFDGLNPEVEALLNAAKSDLPPAAANPELIGAMTLALSVDALAPTHRSHSLVGKALTAKTAAMASVLLLSCGVAAASTGTLPAAAQNAASHAAEHVGLHIPKSGDDSGDTKDNGTTPTSVVHPDNHGNDVSSVAHDTSNTGVDHGTAVCTVASEGKCKSGDSGTQGSSADHRQDGDHPTTSTTVNEDSGGPSGHPNQDSNPGTSHHSGK